MFLMCGHPITPAAQHPPAFRQLCCWAPRATSCLSPYQGCFHVLSGLPRQYHLLSLSQNFPEPAQSLLALS